MSRRMESREEEANLVKELLMSMSRYSGTGLGVGEGPRGIEGIECLGGVCRVSSDDSQSPSPLLRVRAASPQAARLGGDA